MYFVMLNHPGLPAVPLMEGEDKVVFFDSREDARLAAEDSPLGQAFGFDIFQIGNGEI